MYALAPRSSSEFDPNADPDFAGQQDDTLNAPHIEFNVISGGSAGQSSTNYTVSESLGTRVEDDNGKEEEMDDSKHNDDEEKALRAQSVSEPMIRVKNHGDAGSASRGTHEYPSLILSPAKEKGKEEEIEASQPSNAVDHQFLSVPVLEKNRRVERARDHCSLINPSQDYSDRTAGEDQGALEPGSNHERHSVPFPRIRDSIRARGRVQSPSTPSSSRTSYPTL